MAIYKHPLSLECFFLDVVGPIIHEGCADKLNIMRLQINIREKKSKMSRLNMLPLGLVYQDLLKTYTIVTNPQFQRQKIVMGLYTKSTILTKSQMLHIF